MKNIVDVELTVYDQRFIYNGIRCRNAGLTDKTVCFETEDGARGELPYGTEVVLTWGFRVFSDVVKRYHS